jgi:hypothetical protein
MTEQRAASSKASELPAMPAPAISTSARRPLTAAPAGA